MADKPFKEWMDAAAVGRIGERLGQARPGWDVGGFVAEASGPLAELELKDRIRHVASVLRRRLADDWAEAVAHMVDSLPPPLPPDGETLSDSFDVWPFCQVVEAHGVDHFEVSVGALAELTRRFTSEGAVRPYIERYPERMFVVLHEWAGSDDAHLRRLATEGTRPRLPWAGRLRELQADPSPALALLERLKEDSSLYVRRSVANHLNDVSKDHPELAVEVARRWSSAGEDGAPASKELRWVVRHALRSLVKAGHPGALDVMGYGPPQVEVAALGVSPAVVELGGAVELTATLRSTGERAQALLIDYAEHRPLKNGKTGRKVFKGVKRRLAPGASAEVRCKHSLKAVTTRAHRAGGYRLELLINGESMGEVDFELRRP